MHVTNKSSLMKISPNNPNSDTKRQEDESPGDCPVGERSQRVSPKLLDHPTVVLLTLQPVEVRELSKK
jgi:hypothetical protein